MRFRFHFVLTGALLCTSSLFAQSANTAQTETSAKASTNAAQSGQASAATTDADYKIGPQDVLRIDVWKEPDISRTIPVRPDGKISLPLLNDVQAAGMTAMQL